MTSIVCFHAHPDDEAIASGGTIAKLVADGHNVTLVFATRGEVGEVQDGFLADGVTLGEARELEARKAAEILGAQRIEFLGYRDSGMENTVTPDSTSDAFCNANPEEAAGKLVQILNETQADLMTTYDPNGGYFHPDHMQVHQVGNLAADLAEKKPRILWTTMNRDHFMKLRETNEEIRAQMDSMSQGDEGLEKEMGDAGADANEWENEEGKGIGWPDAEITHCIDVNDFLEQKIKSLKAHASQITDDSFFMKLTDEAKKLAIGVEWFVDPAQKVSDPKLTDILS